MESDWGVTLAILAALSPVLLAILGGVGWLYKHERERRQAIEAQLSEHKYKAYIRLLEIFFGLMKSTIKKEQIRQNDMVDEMLDASKDLMVYGSDDVLRTYQEWIFKARIGKASLHQFGEIVIAVRRDMGNPRTKITAEKILRQLILDYDDAKEKGIL